MSPFVLVLGITIADLRRMSCQSSVEGLSFRSVHVKRVFLHNFFREGRAIFITSFLYSLFTSQYNYLGYLNRLRHNNIIISKISFSIKFGIWDCICFEES